MSCMVIRFHAKCHNHYNNFLSGGIDDEEPEEEIKLQERAHFS